jgi:hypothetical protein
MEFIKIIKPYIKKEETQNKEITSPRLAHSMKSVPEISAFYIAG